MMARLDHDGDAGQRLFHDAWDGFPAARNRVTSVLADAKVRNPVVHILRDFDRPDSGVVATEFVGTSV